MRRVPQGILLSLMLAASGRADAQEWQPGGTFDSKGDFVVSVERLFGYVHVGQTQDGPIPGSTSMTKTTTTSNSISVLGSSLNSLAGVFTFPRVGFDVFVMPGLSVGGAVTYFHLSSKNDLDLGQPPDNVATTIISGYLLAPRIGYTVRVGRRLWIWPRAGITYANFSSSNSNGLAANASTFSSTSSASLTAITVEAPLAISLGSRAVLLVGPTVDIGLAGTGKNSVSQGDVQNDSTSGAARESNLGLQAGVALSF